MNGLRFRHQSRMAGDDPDTQGQECLQIGGIRFKVYHHWKLFGKLLSNHFAELSKRVCVILFNRHHSGFSVLDHFLVTPIALAMTVHHSHSITYAKNCSMAS